jgi:hypothetical protein
MLISIGAGLPTCAAALLILKQHEQHFKEYSRSGLNIAAGMKKVTGKHPSGDLR